MRLGPTSPIGNAMNDIVLSPMMTRSVSILVNASIDGGNHEGNNADYGKN